MLAVPVAFAVSLLAALALTPLVRAGATRAEWVSRPRVDRWNRRTVALAGGIAIAAATASGCLTVVGRMDRQALCLLAASTFMFFVGLLDDRFHLKPLTKFLAQILVAVGLVEVGFRFGLEIPGFVYFDHFLTILWLVGVTNALNLLDNMDGLCAGIAAIAALALTAIHALSGEVMSAAMTAALAGAALGFLRYNFSPASIFMGDCGSLFLGLFLAGAPLLRRLGGESSGIVATLGLPVLVLMVPLLDVTLVTLARQWARRPVSQGGCDHTSHRLVAIGMTERRAVLFLWALAAAGGATALAVSRLSWTVANLLGPLFVLIVGAVALHLAQVKVYQDQNDLGAALERLSRVFRPRNRKLAIELGFDAVTVAVGFYLACLLRYESELATPSVWAVFTQSLPVVLLAHLAAYLWCGVYRSIWSHAGVSDLPRFVQATAVGLCLSLVSLQLLELLGALSRTLLPLNALVQLALLAGTRIGWKVLRDVLADGRIEPRRRVLVVGSGQESDLVLRRLRLDDSLGLEPAGVICEEPEQVGLEIQGTPVVGTSEAIRDVLSRQGVSEALLVDRHYPAEGWERIRRVCAELGVPTRTYQISLQAVEEPAPPGD